MAGGGIGGAQRRAGRHSRLALALALAAIPGAATVPYWQGQGPVFPSWFPVGLLPPPPSSALPSPPLTPTHLLV